MGKMARSLGMHQRKDVELGSTVGEEGHREGGGILDCRCDQCGIERWLGLHDGWDCKVFGIAQCLCLQG